MGDYSWWIPGGLAAAAGVAVLLWALFRDRARGRKRCPRCWYDMGAAVSLRCPECGREAKSARALGRTRRRWGRAAVGLLLVVVGTMTAAVPTYRQGGWLGLLPTTAMIGLQPSFESANTAVRDAFFAELDRRPMSRWQYRWFAEQNIAAAARTPADQPFQLQSLYRVFRFREGDGPFLSSSGAFNRRSGRTEKFAHLALNEAGLDPAWAVSNLRTVLDRDDDDAIFWSALLLGHFGHHAAPAVPRLIELLERPRGGMVIASAIAGIGCDAVEPTLAVLKGPSPIARTRAILALSTMEALTPETESALRTSLDDLYPENRKAAAIGLAAHQIVSPRILAVLIESLEQSGRRMDYGLLSALGTLGPSATEALPALRLRMDSAANAGSGRLDLADTITCIDPSARDALVTILEFAATPDHDSWSATRASSILEKLALADQNPRTALVELLEDPSPDVQQRAEGALRRLDDSVAPHLVQATISGSTELRFRAVLVLAQMGTIADPTVAADVAAAKQRAIRDPDQAVRIAATWWARDDGAPMPPAEELFEIVATSSNTELAQTARALLFRGVSDESRADLLAQALTDSRPAWRKAAASILLERPYEPAAQDALARAMGNPSPEIRLTAAAALTHSELADDAVACLTALLTDPDPALRRDAALELRFGGDAAQAALPALRAAADDPDPEAAAAIADAIAALDPYRPEADVPMLVASLSDEDPRTRQVAAEVLAELGPKAAEALPALERLKSDGDAEVRSSADAAIRAISGEGAIAQEGAVPSDPDPDGP